VSGPANEPRERCRGCGAEFKDLVCEYCGLASLRAADPALERAALDELHVLLRRCEPDAQSRLLRDGFLPSSEANLLEAAVQCLPYVAKDAVEPGPAAVLRLEAIVAKLVALPPNDGVRQAIAHYQARVEAYRRADRHALIGGLTVFAILGAAIIAAIAWLVSRIS
jgi:hypothetical protein